MSNRASFADFFKLAPGLIALDRELDAEGCPVSYRKYLAVEWLIRTDCRDNTIKQLKTAISDMDLDVQSACSTWYNNVYGHTVYEPPASRFIALSTPVPITVTWSPFDSEVTMPDITLIQYELQESLFKLLNPEGFLLVGIQKLQELPMARWVWLAMADYDISVTSFALTRPAYHLSLWHSFQALEKLLKAVLIVFGETELSLQKYSHNIHKLISALNKHGFSLTNRGTQIAHEISNLVGGPSVRYLDDSLNRSERLILADRSVRVHHLLLELFALDAERIGTMLSTGSVDSVFGINSQDSDLDLRRKVHIEHKKMCSR
ncbi:HEPN domain-containing protein [Candidatus Thiosymbion oneisti]|uniref:HEPN domain-containing protein n=1 Tax=Candidatus Thiosymbion oneisti TaxID=589554 RepID=UPI00105F09F1|nr:HEPN domain-containing protein [Candidatus Thiosymbion oneisti]